MKKIILYKYEDTWYFDDESRGIKFEPFILGASDIIIQTLERKGYENANYGIPVEFSTEGSESNDIYLSLLNSKLNLGIYQDQKGNTCWLCSTQLHLLDNVQEIYVTIGKPDEAFEKPKNPFDTIDWKYPQLKAIAKDWDNEIDWSDWDMYIKDKQTQDYLELFG